MAKRLKDLDVMRGFAILAVVIIHVSTFGFHFSNISSISKDFLMLVNQFSRFAVPIFIFISGVGLTITYNPKIKYFSFQYKRLIKIIPYYFVWTIIYWVYLINTGTNSLSITEIIKSFIGGSASYQLYFVPLIIQFYLLFPLFYKLFKHNSMLLISFIINIALWSYQYYDHPSQFISLFLDMKNFINWIFFFGFGIWIAPRIQSIKETVVKYKIALSIIFSLSIVFLTIESIIYHSSVNLGIATSTVRPSVIIYTIIVVIWILSLNWSNNFMEPILSQLSKRSFGIYLSHALVLNIVVGVFRDINVSNIYLFLLTGTIVVTVVSFYLDFIWSIIYEKISLIGKTNNTKNISR